MSNEPSSVKDGSNAFRNAEREYRTINLSGLVVTISRRRRVIYGFALAGLVLAIVMAYAIRPEYDATVRFLPPEQKELSPLSMFSTKSPGDHYLGLVSSRTVADDVIERQHLMGYFHSRNLSGARRQLASMSKIVVDKDQFITVTVRAAEPQTAMNIANEYLAALYRLNNTISLSEAQHRWAFYEEPLEREKNRLADAEEALKQAQEKTGVVLPEAQMRLGVTAIADLKQQLAVKEVQLASLRTGGTEQNPQIIQLKSQVASLRAQIEQMQRETSGRRSATSTAQLPALTMEVERRVRDVKFHETLFEILSRQSENARVDQSYTPSVELVDRAVLPDEKSWPPRKVLLIAGLLGGALLGALYVLLQAAEIPRRWHNFLQQYDESSQNNASVE